VSLVLGGVGDAVDSRGEADRRDDSQKERAAKIQAYGDAARGRDQVREAGLQWDARRQNGNSQGEPPAEPRTAPLLLRD
jgi:hypothetical protein